MALTLLGALVFSLPALGAGDPQAGPKPDPPPKAHPPPPPPQPPPPPAVQPAAPAPVTAPPPAARVRVAPATKVKTARAGAKRSAKNVATAHRRIRAQDALVAAHDTPSNNWGLPFLILAFSAALVLLGLALTPARAVPWSRASRVLEDRRDELGVLGAMGLVATVVFFLLIQVTN